MQIRHVDVAARHTLSILRWAVSRDPMDEVELREVFDTVYRDSDFGIRNAAGNGTCEAWRSITFDGVRLAYDHFFGRDCDMPEIREFLTLAGDNEDLGILYLEACKVVL